MRANETETVDRCETCGDQATQWDYDQMMCFCERHVQQADFTVPLVEIAPLRARLQLLEDAIDDIRTTWEIADEHHRTGVDPTGYGDLMRWHDVGVALRKVSPTSEP